jgi:hypothetical protein
MIELLPSKHEALSLTPNIAKNKAKNHPTNGLASYAQIPTQKHKNYEKISQTDNSKS